MATTSHKHLCRHCGRYNWSLSIRAFSKLCMHVETNLIKCNTRQLAHLLRLTLPPAGRGVAYELGYPCRGRFTRHIPMCQGDDPVGRQYNVKGRDVKGSA
jgi:hypothetical protein